MPGSESRDQMVMMAVNTVNCVFVFIIWAMFVISMPIRMVNGDVLSTFPKWPFPFHPSPRVSPPVVRGWLDRQWTVRPTNLPLNSFPAHNTGVPFPLPKTYTRLPWLGSHTFLWPMPTQPTSLVTSTLSSTLQPSTYSNKALLLQSSQIPFTSEETSIFSDVTMTSTAPTDAPLNATVVTRIGTLASEASTLHRINNESGAPGKKQCFLNEESCGISQVTRLNESEAHARHSNFSKEEDLKRRDPTSSLGTLMTSFSTRLFNLHKENVSHLAKSPVENESGASKSPFKSEMGRPENITNLLDVAPLAISGVWKPERRLIPSRPAFNSSASQTDSSSQENTKTADTMPINENASTSLPRTHPGGDSSVITLHLKVASMKAKTWSATPPSLQNHSRDTLWGSSSEDMHFPLSLVKFDGILFLQRKKPAEFKQRDVNGNSTAKLYNELSGNDSDDFSNRGLLTSAHGFFAGKGLDKEGHGKQGRGQSVPNQMQRNDSSHSLAPTTPTESVANSSVNSSEPSVPLRPASKEKSNGLDSSWLDTKKTIFHVYFSFNRSNSAANRFDTNIPVQKEVPWSAVSKVTASGASSTVSKDAQRVQASTPVLDKYRTKPTASTVIFDHDIILPASPERTTNYTHPHGQIDRERGRITRDLGSHFRQLPQGSGGQPWKSAPQPGAAGGQGQSYRGSIGHGGTHSGEVQRKYALGLTQADTGTTTAVWSSTSAKRTESRRTETPSPGKNVSSGNDDRQNGHSITRLPVKNAESSASSRGSNPGMFSLLRLRNNLDTVIKLIHVYEDFHKKHWASSSSPTTTPSATTSHNGSGQSKESNTSGSEISTDPNQNPSPPDTVSDDSRSGHDSASGQRPLTNNNNNVGVNQKLAPYPESVNNVNNVMNPGAAYGSVYDGSRGQQGTIANNSRTSQNTLAYMGRPQQPPAPQTSLARPADLGASGLNAARARGGWPETLDGPKPGSMPQGSLNPGVPSAGGQQASACVDPAGGLIRAGSFRDIGTLDVACRCPSTLPTTGRQGVLPSAACFRREDTCEWKGQLFAKGEWFSPLPCMECVCQEGTPQCQDKQCPPVSCPNPVPDADGCCKSCRQGAVGCLLPDGSVLAEGRKAYVRVRNRVELCVCYPITGNQLPSGPRYAFCQ